MLSPLVIDTQVFPVGLFLEIPLCWINLKSPHYTHIVSTMILGLVFICKLEEAYVDFVQYIMVMMGFGEKGCSWV